MVVFTHIGLDFVQPTATTPQSTNKTVLSVCCLALLNVVVRPQLSIAARLTLHDCIVFIARHSFGLLKKLSTLVHTGP